MTAPVSAGLNVQALVRLNTALTRLIEARGVPGAVVLIERRGVLGHFDCLGQQDPSGGIADARRFDLPHLFDDQAHRLGRADDAGRARPGLLRDPVAKYLPEFGGVKLHVERGDRVELVAPRRAMTIHDLLRHTAGADL